MKMPKHIASHVAPTSVSREDSQKRKENQNVNTIPICPCSLDQLLQVRKDGSRPQPMDMCEVCSDMGKQVRIGCHPLEKNTRLTQTQTQTQPQPQPQGDTDNTSHHMMRMNIHTKTANHLISHDTDEQDKSQTTTPVSRAGHTVKHMEYMSQSEDDMKGSTTSNALDASLLAVKGTLMKNETHSHHNYKSNWIPTPISSSSPCHPFNHLNDVVTEAEMMNQGTRISQTAVRLDNLNQELTRLKKEKADFEDLSSDTKLLEPLPPLDELWSILDKYSTVLSKLQEAYTKYPHRMSNPAYPSNQDVASYQQTITHFLQNVQQLKQTLQSVIVQFSSQYEHILESIVQDTTKTQSSLEECQREESQLHKATHALNTRLKGNQEKNTTVSTASNMRRTRTLSQGGLSSNMRRGKMMANRSNSKSDSSSPSTSQSSASSSESSSHESGNESSSESSSESSYDCTNKTGHRFRSHDYFHPGGRSRCNSGSSSSSSSNGCGSSSCHDKSQEDILKTDNIKSSTSKQPTNPNDHSSTTASSGCIAIAPDGCTSSNRTEDNSQVATEDSDSSSNLSSARSPSFTRCRYKCYCADKDCPYFHTEAEKRIHSYKRHHEASITHIRQQGFRVPGVAKTIKCIYHNPSAGKICARYASGGAQSCIYSHEEEDTWCWNTNCWEAGHNKADCPLREKDAVETQD